MIFEIYPSVKANNMQGLLRLLRYIKDLKKCLSDESSNDLDKNKERLTELLNNIHSDSAVKRALKYISDENKTELNYISGHLCDPDTAYEEMIANIDLVVEAIRGEIEGIICYHWIQSFPNELRIPNEEVHQCGVEMAQFLSDYQCVVSSHVHPVEKSDGLLHGKCKHNHGVMSAYKHFSKLDLANNKQAKFNLCTDAIDYCRRENDRIALEHGLPIIIETSGEKKYNWYDDKLMKSPKSWKAKVKEDVDTAKRKSSNLISFKARLVKLGYKIKDGKHITLTTPKEDKIRLETLGSSYATDHLKEYFDRKTFVDYVIDRQQEVNTKDEQIKPNFKTDALDNVIEKHGYDLFVCLDIAREDKKGRYKMAFDLNTHKHEEIFERYIELAKVYELLINKDGEFVTVGAVTGQDLHAYYLMQKEDDYKPLVEELEREKTRTRTHIYYTNYKTKKVIKYDPFYNLENKSNLELLIILAMVLIYRDIPMYNEPVCPNRIYAYRNRRLQNQIDTLSLISKENVPTKADLDRELKLEGQKIGFIQRDIKGLQNTLANMQYIRDAIDYLASPENIGDRNIDERNYCKNVLYRADVVSKTKRNDFIARYDSVLANIATAEEELEKSKKRYKNLKMIERNTRRAQRVIDEMNINIDRDSVDIQKERLRANVKVTRESRERDDYSYIK